MKITAVRALPLSLPLKFEGEAPKFAGGARTNMDMLLVRVDTDEGITGWGEAFGPRVWPATCAALDKVIAPLCIGRDAANIEALHQDLMRRVHSLGRSGALLFALSGLDIALWDIAGKRAGVPICRLLDAAPRRSMRAYASLLRYGDPKRVSEMSAEAVRRGYRHVKLHETRIAEMRAARDAVGSDVELMVDANCPWTVAETLSAAAAMRELRLAWLEEPLWPPDDYAGLAKIRAESGIPLAAGENVGNATEFSNLLNARAVDYAQPSVIKVGGITETLRVIELAAAAGVRVNPHSAYFGPGLLATLHVCAAFRQIALIERYYCDLAANPVGDAIAVRDGEFAVPQGPGLGFEPDASVIERYQAG